MSDGADTNHSRQRVERWFLSRGLPHFIDDYSATRDVFTRALPALTLFLLFEVIGALNFEWAWWVNVLVAAGCFAALLTVWAVVNATRHRPLLARPERVGKTEIGVFLLVPPLLPLVAGGQRLTAVNTFAANVLLLVIIYFATSYGLLPMTRWAGSRFYRQVSDVLGLLVRALPLLLLFVTFLFLTAESWQVAANLDGPFLWVTIGLFVLFGTVFVVARIPSEVGNLSTFESWADVCDTARDTPADALSTQAPARDNPATGLAPPLSRRQWANVGLVVLFSQGLQIVFVSLMIGFFLVGFGLLTVTPDTAAAWSGAPVDVLVDWHLWGRPVTVTAELLQVTGFLTAFSGLYFTVYLITDATYRREFLDEVLVELRQSLAVRAVYLASLPSEAPAGG